MAIAMTEEQQRDFEEKGYVILDDFLEPPEVGRLLEAVDEVAARLRESTGLGPDEPFAVRNALSQHDAFLDLIDHPKALPLVVDAIGWNIQIRTSHLDYRPPYPDRMRAGGVGRGDGEDNQAGYRNVNWHPDLAGSYLFEAPSLDGRLPFMEVKIFYAFSDLTESDSGNLWVVPGSHLRPPQELRDGSAVDPGEAVELRVPPGTAVLWRTATWHCVGPNLSARTRKIMHVGYHYRWLRPTDYIEQDSRADRAQLSDPPPVAGSAGHRVSSTRGGAGVLPRLPALDHLELGRRSAQGLGRGAGRGRRGNQPPVTGTRPKDRVHPRRRNLRSAIPGVGGEARWIRRARNRIPPPNARQRRTLPGRSGA